MPLTLLPSANDMPLSHDLFNMNLDYANPEGLAAGAALHNPDYVTALGMDAHKRIGLCLYSCFIHNSKL